MVRYYLIISHIQIQNIGIYYVMYNVMLLNNANEYYKIKKLL